MITFILAAATCKSIGERDSDSSKEELKTHTAATFDHNKELDS